MGPHTVTKAGIAPVDKDGRELVRELLFRFPDPLDLGLLLLDLSLELLHLALYSFLLTRKVRFELVDVVGSLESRQRRVQGTEDIN